MPALILNDHPECPAMLQAMLTRRGHQVSVACSVAEGEAWLTRTQRPRLMLLDTHLRNGLSLGLLDYARIRHPEMTIVLMTGSTAYCRGELHWLANSADWIMMKPVLSMHLEAVLDHLEATRRPDRAMSA